MGNFFGCAKSRQAKLNQQEQAIFDCKKTRDKIKEYIKRLQKIETLRKEEAKRALKEKNRDRAKLFLKQSKLYAEQINSATGQLNAIEEQITRIETAEHQKEILTVLEQGNKVLKSLTEEVNVEKLEKVVDDMNDLKYQQEEIANFFKNHGMDENLVEEEVDKELEKLMQLENKDVESLLPEVTKKFDDTELPEVKKSLPVENHQRILI